MRFSTILVVLVLLCNTALRAQDVPLTLPIQGKVFNAERKLPGCEVITFKGNERIYTQVTDRGGRFQMEFGMGEEYAIEFRMEGFLPKRILVDTRAELPKDIGWIVPLAMTMSMLPSSKYEGADTDALDFPFAIVRYDSRARAFLQNNEYTADMMRTNGALLLMSGRSEKR